MRAAAEAVIGLTALHKAVSKKGLSPAFLSWWIVNATRDLLSSDSCWGRRTLRALLLDMSAQRSEVFWDILVSSLRNCTTSLSEITSQSTQQAARYSCALLHATSENIYQQGLKKNHKAVSYKPKTHYKRKEIVLTCSPAWDSPMMNRSPGPSAAVKMDNTNGKGWTKANDGFRN